MTVTFLNTSPSPRPLDADVLQRRASDPAQSVWVSASAGSGKTKVLADRVIRLLLAGTLPHRILCLTFTKAAAAEMSIRISNRLGAWTVCSDDALRDDLYDLEGKMPSLETLQHARRLFAAVLDCPGGLRIRTLHAFAQELLRRFPVEAGVSPHFRLLEDGEAKEWMGHVRDELLLKAADDAACPLACALTYAARHLGDSTFAKLIDGLTHERARLQEALRLHQGAEGLTRHLRHSLDLKDHLTEESLILAGCRDESCDTPALRRMGEVMLGHTKSKNSPVHGRAILDWLAQDETKRAATFPDYCDVFVTDKNIPRKILVNDLIKSHPDLVDVALTETQRLIAVQERLRATRIAAASTAMITAGAALIEAWRQRKETHALLDYDDLIERAVGLLTRPGIAPWVLYKLDGGLDHILIDEAQDTSPTQWKIVNALTDEFFSGLGTREATQRTIFVVGDRKQSIYSFQHADPDIFESMHDAFAQRLAAVGQKLETVELMTSFRSTRTVLQAVDTVFARPATRVGVAHTEIVHKAHRAEAEGRVEVWPLLVAPTYTPQPWAISESYEQVRNPAAALAAAVADQIKSWIGQEKLPAYGNRSVEAGDIMILVRRRNEFVDALVRELKQRHVPVAGVDRMKLMEQISVLDLLAVAQFALLPEDDLVLATLLRGPLIGASDEDVFDLAHNRPHSLWASLGDKAQKNEKYAIWHAYLAHWLARADLATPFAFFAEILTIACPADEVSGRRAMLKRLGLDAEEPIDELLTMAQDYGRRRIVALQGFVQTFLRTEIEIKRELDHGQGQVRIMTVHGAKGLQAPIVILPDTTAVPRSQELPRLLWNSDGIPFFIRGEKHTDTSTLPLFETARRKQLEEYRRLLYVALTRAADRLYVCGWRQERAESEECWYRLIRESLAEIDEPHEHRLVPLLGETEEKIIAFTHAQIAKERAEKKQLGTGRKTAAPLILPDVPMWARRAAPAEDAAPRTLAPSHFGEDDTPVLQPLGEDDGWRFARGKLIHRLLQSLPDLPAAKREEAAHRYLSYAQHRLSEAQQRNIVAETLAILNHPAYRPLFGPDSRAEVPLAGLAMGKLVSGQIDRLCLTPDEVLIIDYKTDRPPPTEEAGVPEAYRLQMKAYTELLREIYPDRRVRSFLLWTCGPWIMELNDSH